MFRAALLLALFTSCAMTSSSDYIQIEPKDGHVVLRFEAEIEAPVEKVWETMFTAETYTKWTAPFAPGSYFEGTWGPGERLHFLAPGGSGMVAEVAAYSEHEFVCLQHLGTVAGGVEDTTSDAVKAWAPVYENYRLESTPTGTRVIVEQETQAAYEGFLKGTWSKALAELAKLSEE